MAPTPPRQRLQKPPPFDKGPVKIALVQNSGAGDYFELWTNGATAQANAVGFEMQLYDAKADGPAGRRHEDCHRVPRRRHHRGPWSVIHHVPADRQATEAGIAVVVYDVKVAECAPKAVETAQNDADLATLVLTQMAKDIGDGVAGRLCQPVRHRPARAARRRVEEVRRRPQVGPEVHRGQVQPRRRGRQRAARRSARSRPIPA